MSKPHSKYLIVPLFLAQFGNILDFMLILPLGPTFMRELTLSPQQFSEIITSYAFACAIAGVLAFVILDKFDRRSLFLSALAIFFVCNIACAFSTSYLILLVARAFSGFGAGLLEAATFTLVGDLFHPQQRGAVTGKIIASFSLASLAGVPLGLLIANAFGWRFVFFFVGLIAAIALLIALFHIPSSKGHLSGDRSLTHVIEQLLKRRRPLEGLLFVATVMLGVFLVIPFIGSSLVFNGKIPESWLPVVYMAGGLGSIIATPYAGKLVDKFGRWSTYKIIAPLGGAALALLLLLHDITVPIACMFIALSMSLNGSRTVVAMTMINDIPHSSVRAGYLSLKSSVQYTMGGIATLISGALVSFTESHTLQGMSILAGLSFILSLLSIPLARRISGGA